MKNTFLKTVFVAAALGWSSIGLAGPIVTFTSINGPSVAADFEAAGATGFNLGRSSGLVANAGSTFNSRDWEEGSDKLSALANNNAIFWGFSSTIGFDLTTLDIGYDRSGLGPTSIAIDLFLSGVSQGEIFRNSMVLDSSTQSATVDLSAFTNVSVAFFRLSGWGAVSSAGTFDIENRAAFNGKGIVINGTASTVEQVPAPATLALLGLGLAGLGWKRRKS